MRRLRTSCCSHTRAGGGTVPGPLSPPVGDRSEDDYRRRVEAKGGAGSVASRDPYCSPGSGARQKASQWVAKTTDSARALPVKISAGEDSSRRDAPPVCGCRPADHYAVDASQGISTAYFLAAAEHIYCPRDGLLYRRSNDLCRRFRRLEARMRAALPSSA